jgi:hypothetical protein
LHLVLYLPKHYTQRTVSVIGVYRYTHMSL